MRDRLPPLDWLRTFEAAARLGSFTAAAEELVMTQASISYHIRSLEKWLGASLFERMPRSVHLTEIGRGYLPAIRRTLDELAAATTDLFGAVSKRNITVQAPTAFAALWLAPRLHLFSSAHPDTEIRLQTTNWPAPVADGDIDVDIRYGDGSWPNLVCQLLLDEPAVMVCAPHLIKRPCHDLADLAGLPLIHVLGTGDPWENLGSPGSGDKHKTRKLLKVDSSVVALEMATAGAGVALVLRSFAAPYLQNGRLIRPLPHEVPTGQAHYLITAVEAQRPTKETTAFLAWLRQQLEMAQRPLAEAMPGETPLGQKRKRAAK